MNKDLTDKLTLIRATATESAEDKRLDFVRDNQLTVECYGRGRWSVENCGMKVLGKGTTPHQAIDSAMQAGKGEKE